MLGQDLTAHLKQRHEVVPLTRADADVTNAGLIQEAVDKANADAVIHCAAFTAVDECERQPELAFQVNAEGTRHVAAACRRSSLPLLYVSTDYVFDGEKPSPYIETDQPKPINVYGRSKLQGERYVSELVARSWIVRVSWLFGPLGRNFVSSILARAQRGEPLRVVNDQVGAPTYTADLAERLERLIQDGTPGVYHITNQAYCSWFEFAQEILRQTSSSQQSGHGPLSAIPTSESGRLAARPKNSRLANIRLAAAGLGVLPPWQDALHRYFLRRGWSE